MSEGWIAFAVAIVVGQMLVSFWIGRERGRDDIRKEMDEASKQAEKDGTRSMKTLRVVLTISSMAISITGCATENRALNCAGWRSIHPSREDVLTRGTKEQILAHNEFGVHQGGWAQP
jgi:hypothetical protein